MLKPSVSFPFQGATLLEQWFPFNGLCLLEQKKFFDHRVEIVTGFRGLLGTAKHVFWHRVREL